MTVALAWAYLVLGESVNDEPSAGGEPSAGVNDEPSAGGELSAVVNKDSSAGLHEKPSAGAEVGDVPFGQMGLSAPAEPPSFGEQPSQPVAQVAPETPEQPVHHEPVIRQYQHHSNQQHPPSQPTSTPQPAVAEPSLPVKMESLPVKMDKAFLILLQELGIDPSTVPPEQLNVLPKIIGQMTRKTIGGLIQLLMSRANLKNEFRMSVTMIQTQENNPLKFCVNEEQAIKQMLVNPMTGYLGPVEALEEALDDFQVHQLAVMSATRSALNYMLKRLDPERLEQKFEDSKSKGMMLGNKRARYWEAYKEFYQDILEEENVFQSLFGNEFANAYEKQVQAFLNGKKGG